MYRRILTASILVPVVVAAITLAPFYLFLMLVGIVIGLCLHEFDHLLKRYQGKVSPPTWIFALLTPWIFSFYPHLFQTGLLLAFLVILLWSVLEARDMSAGFAEVAGNILALVYIGIPVAIITSYQRFSPLKQGQDNPVYEMLLVMAIVWVSDSAAYFVGRRFGTHKVTPHISPNKSMEGFLAAVIVPAILTPLLGGYLVPSKGWGFLLIAGVTLSIVGTIGDLFESMLKRGAGIKDTSNLLPGHGGVLDRLDSLLFAFPAYYLLSEAMAQFNGL